MWICTAQSFCNVFPPLHRGVFCQFPFRWIYYYGSNKSTGKETGKMHPCAVQQSRQQALKAYCSNIYCVPHAISRISWHLFCILDAIFLRRSQKGSVGFRSNFFVDISVSPVIEFLDFRLNLNISHVFCKQT